jgi:DNA polymerase III epsilon subunit family exonuclease
VRQRALERKLLWGVVAMFVVPTALTEGILIVLYRRGVFQDVGGLLLAVLISLAAIMAYLSWIAYALARPVIRTVRMIRDGTELMTTVNPGHRIEVRTGDELEALAEDINRLADHLREAKGGLRSRVAEATRALQVERETLAAIVDALADGVVVATLDGRITLANPVAQALLMSGGSLVGRNLFDLVDPSGVARFLDELRNGGRGAQRFAITPPDGVELHAGMTSLLDVDGRLTGVILALRDASRPVDESAGDPAASRSPAPRRFTGAGLASGIASDTPGPMRPELYDFSLFEEMERNVAAAQREHRLDELPFVVLDVETTGLRADAGDRIVSLAGVRVRAGIVRAGERFDALVCPERPIPAASTRFHGITDTMVVEAPVIGVVLPAFLRFAEGAVLVGHEVSFDVAFLDRDLRRLGLPPLPAGHPVMDTRLLSRLVHGPGLEHTLEAVAERLGVRMIGRHSALGDALTTAEIFVRLLALLKKRGLVTLGATLDALRSSRP